MPVLNVCSDEFEDITADLRENVTELQHLLECLLCEAADQALVAQMQDQVSDLSALADRLHKISYPQP